MNETPNYVFLLNEYSPIEDWDGVETCWVHVVDTNDETYHPEL